VLQKEDNDWVKKFMEYKVSVPDQETDQRILGPRLWKKTGRHLNWTERISWIVIDGASR